MKSRPIEEIEKAFREMGITEATWGKMPISQPEEAAQLKPEAQFFIRIETTTTVLERKPDADLASPRQRDQAARSTYDVVRREKT